MCQAIAQGGRRCPIHRRETMILLGNIQEKTTLKDSQVRQLFSELRREGRHSLSHGPDYWNAYLDSMTLSTRDESVAREVELARKEGQEPDGATLYALRRFQTRAVQRSLNLESKLSAIATAKGWSEEEAREKFNAAYEAVDTSRGAAVPEEFTTSAVREARNAGLPYDKQTVVALARLNNEKVEFERVPRVTRQPMHTSSSIAEAGYADGRLEVVFHSNPDRVYAYHSVPQQVWDSMTLNSPGRVYVREVRGIPAYRYESQEAADADAHRIRCTGCGQFVAAAGGHTCPVHEAAVEAAVEAEASTIAKEDAATKAPVNPPAPVVDDSGIDTKAVQRQLNPPALEPPAPVLVLGEGEPYSFRRREIMRGGTDLERHSRYYSDEFSKEDMEKIANAPATTKFVIGFERDEEGNRVRVADSRSGFKRKIEFVSENGEHTFEYNRSAIIVYNAPPSTVEKLSAEEFQKQRDAEREAHAADPNVVRVDSTATASRQYKPDGNAASPASVSWAKVRDFRKHINEGKTVTSNLEWKFTAPRRGMPSNPRVDDQGHVYPEQYPSRTVSGQLSMRRKADGTMEVVHSRRSLKCDCWDYRRNYHCAHVDYVQRHAANLGQQMMGDPNATTGTSTRRTVERVETPLGEIPRGFYSRPEVSIATDEATGNSYIAFAARNYRSRWTNLAPTEMLTRSYNVESEEDQKAIYVANSLSRISLTNTPPASTIRQGLRYGPVEVPIRANLNLRSYGTISGTIRMEKDEDGNVVVRSRSLRCSCMDYRRNYDCVHVRLGNQANFASLVGETDDEGQYRIRDKYNEVYNARGGWRAMEDIAEAVQYNTSVADVARIRQERQAEEERIAEEARQRRAARRAEEEAERRRSYEEKVAEIRENAAQHRGRIAEKWNNREEGYAENPGAFHDDFNEAIARKKRGEEIIPFKTENVTDGLAADEPGGLAFGVELEFDIKSGVNRREALDRIATELHEAGLTEQAHQSHYHAAQNQSGGAYSRWSFEEDCTVAGELVSPILKDTPEHWTQLKTAVDIITRNGGIASTRAGSHVHVSSANFENSTAKHVELLRTVKANEDTLYRVASNPSRGSHRGTGWCAPNSAELTDGREITKEVKEGHYLLGSHSHGAALNMGASSNMSSPKASHVEFRMWDSTLDPGIIQQQIAYSVAMTDRADRVVEETGSSKFPEKRVLLGSTKRNGKASSASDKEKLDREAFMDENGHAGAFIDSLFRRKEDRQRATALFAVNNWVG